jgi:hypothetical protein
MNNVVHLHEDNDKRVAKRSHTENGKTPSSKLPTIASVPGPLMHCNLLECTVRGHISALADRLFCPKGESFFIYYYYLFIMLFFYYL